MEPLIRSLHHVTATVGGAQADLDFYAGLLGLRLVKKTVNFDNRRVYHFYYGNERGTPGTLMTTFPYQGMGVPAGRHGAGQIGSTSFSVPAGSLGAWERLLAARGIPLAAQGARFDEELIAFADPSGLVIELVAGDRDARTPWTTAGIGPELAIRGVHGVSLVLRSPPPKASLAFFTDVLGLTVVGESASRTRLAAGRDAPGHTLDLVHRPDAPDGTNGLGTVHHVALAVSDAEEQRRMREELVRLGYAVTEVLDRQYFRSIYFREPGGVLLEIATIPPGFTVDEELAALGRDLKLPPWEEPHRATIEAGLPPVAPSQ